MGNQKYLHRFIGCMTAAVMLIAIVSVHADVAINEQVIKITAKRFEYSPREIRIKKGIPVVLELTSLDRLHGFNCPDLSIRADINPGQITKINFVPQKAGTFVFFCDIFCGEGHEDMNGKFVVEE